MSIWGNSVITCDDYAEVVGPEVMAQLHRLAEHLGPKSFVHVNSTKSGGGVAEILSGAVPLLNQMGIQATWEVIEGDANFFEVTKGFHNGLQGMDVHIRRSCWSITGKSTGTTPGALTGKRILSWYTTPSRPL
jgi:hypothetical protein